MSSLTSHNVNVQIWDNAVFDGPTNISGTSENSEWLPLKENLDPNPIKEPQMPLDIDTEILEIEKEISRLSKKLKLLKIKKLDQDHSKGPAALSGSRGRIVPAKFMNVPPQTPRVPEKKIQESPASRRRGLSLGPMEIYGLATPLSSLNTGQKKPCPPKLEGIKEKNSAKPQQGRRGMSLGPAEIFSAGGQLRKMSKIQEVKEKAVPRARRSMSTSPKSRKPTASKVSELRKGVSTVGPKKVVRREEELATPGNIKPKVLFQESKTPVASGKRPLKSNAKVRIVASRYSLIEPGSKRRKWSLPEAGKEEVEKAGMGISRGRSLSLGGPNVTRPMHLDDDDDDDHEEEVRSPSPIMKMAAALPRIRTLRCAVESPRDSGCAKRVADLVGKRSCFADGDSNSSCQILNLDDED